MAWHQQNHWRILIALVLGLIYGVLAAFKGWGEFTSDWIAPFGAIFLRLLLLIAVPLVLASLITGIASLSDLNKLSRIGGKTIALYVMTTLVALVIGLVAVNILQPGNTVPRFAARPVGRDLRGRRSHARGRGRGCPNPRAAPTHRGHGSGEHSLARLPVTATCLIWCSWPFLWVWR